MNILSLVCTFLLLPFAASLIAGIMLFIQAAGAGADNARKNKATAALALAGALFALIYALAKIAETQGA